MGVLSFESPEEGIYSFLIINLKVNDELIALHTFVTENLIYSNYRCFFSFQAMFLKLI